MTDTYHPNYFNQDESTAIRKDCQKRLDIIKQYVVQNSTLLDVGCSGGYYSFGLADVCSNIVAIDNDKRLVELCNKLKAENKIKNIQFNSKDIILGICCDYDMTLYMSVHHHVIRRVGMERANNVLMEMSRNTNKMIFDMGQKDEVLSKELMSRDVWWNDLPVTDNPAKWTKDYLLANTVFTRASEIGKTKIHKTERVLWLLEK